MADPVQNESCRVCDQNLQKKSRRSIFNQFFTVHDQLCEVIGRVPQPNDCESSYVCSCCFNKLNKLNKLEFDLTNKLAELQKQKISLVQELRGKYLNTRSSRSPYVTPKKLTKRVILHSPPPRKSKTRPEERVREETELQVKPPKKLVLSGCGAEAREFTLGKAKVVFLFMELCNVARP